MTFHRVQLRVDLPGVGTCPRVTLIPNLAELKGDISGSKEVCPLAVTESGQASGMGGRAPGASGSRTIPSDIYPTIEAISLRAIQQATGLSFRQCSRIRRGEVVPPFGVVGEARHARCRGRD